MIQGGRTTRHVVLAAVLLASGCDADEGAAPPAVDKPPAAQKPPETEATTAAPIAIDNGFLPDPHVVRGTVTGTRSAAELADGCDGFVSTEPSQVLEARGTFADLQILAHGDRDVTLLVERPDGTHLCAGSDGDGPVVHAFFPTGTYRIWIGTTERSVEARYALGFSELDDATPASLDPEGP